MSSNKLEALWKYHEAVQKLDQVENRIKTTPQRQRLNKLHRFLGEQQAQIKATQSQIETRKAAVERISALFDELQHQYELEVGEFEIMEKDEECTAAEMTESRRAMEALVEKITGARRELFETIEWIDKTMAEYKNVNARANKVKKEYDAVRIVCEQEVAEAKPEVDACQAEVKKMRALVDPAFLKKYDVVKTHYPVPIAKVENNQCAGCNMSLPTSVVKRVASSDSLVECENCGRILYV
ncbi:MAG: C4-type zinc ribbon domain-containing protein [Clostridia bacterium]|nr:C4-type zinc ribbon domain-containing protein [Clostridia bacterium]